MRKLIVPVLAAAAVIGSLLSQAEAVPVAATMPAFGDGNVVKAFYCRPGRHVGPLLYCRKNTARPLFVFRRPCALGRHRNFFGRCVPNR